MTKVGQIYKRGWIIIFDLFVIYLLVAIIRIAYEALILGLEYVDPTDGVLTGIIAVLIILLLVPVLIYFLIGKTVYNPYHLKQILEWGESRIEDKGQEETQQGNAEGTP